MINTSSVATDLALQTLQNGNGSYFLPPQGHGSSSYSAHKVSKATSG